MQQATVAAAAVLIALTGNERINVILEDAAGGRAGTVTADVWTKRSMRAREPLQAQKWTKLLGIACAATALLLRSVPGAVGAAHLRKTWWVPVEARKHKGVVIG